MNQRFKKVRLDSNLSMKAFGDKIGLVASSVQRAESGAYNPSEQTIRAVCKEFRINRRWLETGEGEMYEPDPKDLIDQIAAERNLGEGAKMLLRIGVRIFEELGPEALDRIIEETIPAIMAERGIPAATLAAERAQPIDNEDGEEIPG